MRHSILSSALSEVFDQLGSRQTLAFLAATSVVLGISGPFDTMTTLGLIRRLGYWSLVVPLTYVAGSFGSALGRRLFARAPVLISVLLISILSAFLVWIVLVITHRVLHFSFATVSEFHAEFPLLVLICLVIEGARMVMIRGRAASVSLPEAHQAQAAPRLLDRLPEGLRGDLVSLSVRDHYVSVSTTAGSHDVLLRLSDAICEVEPVAGLQVHRSHWVATAQVRGWQRTGDKAVLTLSNDAQIPVSRAKFKLVEAAGLLDQPASESGPEGSGAPDAAPGTCAEGSAASLRKGRAQDAPGARLEQAAL